MPAPPRPAAWSRWCSPTSWPSSWCAPSPGNWTPDMEQTGGQRVLATILGWGAALLLFFPVLWTFITSFKTENEAIHASLDFTPTLDGYREVFARADYLAYALNSIAIAVGGTLLALAFAVPAAYAMAFHPTKRT